MNAYRSVADAGFNQNGPELRVPARPDAERPRFDASALARFIAEPTLIHEPDAIPSASTDRHERNASQEENRERRGDDLQPPGEVMPGGLS